jgi:hypothetical protein
LRDHQREEVRPRVARAVQQLVDGAARETRGREQAVQRAQSGKGGVVARRIEAYIARRRGIDGDEPAVLGGDESHRYG